MAREKKAPVEKDHPALMPKLAWQALIKDLMAEHGFRFQNAFAEAIDVCDQTIGRWLGAKPALPEPESFKKVADFLEISEQELSKRWFWFMGEGFGYRQQPAATSEIREPAAVFDEPDPLLQAKALEGLDLKKVPLDQRPFIHLLRRDIVESATELEKNHQQLTFRLRSMIKNLRDLFQSAVDTERKLQRG